MKYLKRSIYNTVLLTVTVISTFSCKEASVKEGIVSLYGKEINFEENYECYIKGKLIPKIADMDKEYKIVTYIDSAFCNSYSLRILEEWKKVLSEFDDKVGFIVIINTNDINNIDLSLRAIPFTRPVVLDKNRDFIKKNNLQKIRAKNRTFLLNSNNKVLLVGEPLGRPKLLETFKKAVI